MHTWRRLIGLRRVTWQLTHTMPVWEVAVETILLRATQISMAVHEEVLRLLLAAGKNLPREEFIGRENREGDPGRGGLQGARPRAWHLGGPASELACE
eukprot:5702577-Pyramimonas_sp.AAC.1